MNVFQPGPENFLELSDTPNSYSGAGGEDVTVKLTEDGLQFSPGSTGVVETIVAGNGIAVDSVDPANPIVSITGYTRTVTVDQGGLGDYTTIKAACDYVATQTPTATTPWQIIVYTGKYSENPFTIPAFVTVSGFVPTTWGNFDTVTVDFTSTITSGIGITMTNNSDIGNLVVKFDGFTATQTGNITLISGASKVTGVFVQAYGFSAHSLTGVSANSSSSYITGTTVEVDNFGAGSARGIASAGNNTNLQDNLVKTYVSGNWGFECTAGTSNLYGNVFEGPSSILRTAGTVNVTGTSYTTTSGTITFANNLSVTDEAYGAGWNGSQQVPTKNAIYDKIEADLVPYTGATADVDLDTLGLKTDAIYEGAGTQVLIEPPTQRLIDASNILSLDWTVRTLDDSTNGNPLLDWSGTNIALKDFTSGIGAILNTSSLTTSDKTFAFPDASGTIALQSVATGTFTTADAKLVTVTNGIIISIV